MLDVARSGDVGGAQRGDGRLRLVGGAREEEDAGAGLCHLAHADVACESGE